MRIKNNSIMSNLGTIRYIDGQFYDSRFKAVFSPLTNAEYKKFCASVESKEEENKRKLTDVELEQIVNDMNSHQPIF